MDRASFLEAVRAAAPKLRKVNIDLLGEVYIRQMTVAEAVKLAADAATEAAQGVSNPVRVIATMVRDETGALLFDQSDAAAMTELAEAAGSMDASIIQSLLEASANVNEPDSEEVDIEGN